jgi:hypothetical protein
MTDREIDALIAKKVMGWTKVKTDDPKLGPNFVMAYGVPPTYAEQIALQGTGEGRNHVPRYTTSMAAAWQVVEKLNCHIVLTVDPADIKPRYAVVYLEGRKLRNGDAQGETMPRAICLAALRRVGVEVPA